MTAYAWPSILKEIPPSGHVVIEASAGTGKTYTLEHLVVHLLLQGEDAPGTGARGAAVGLDEILVVTFTDKATREMRERVRQTLQKVAHHATAPGQVSRLERALYAFDTATISTIHGFCQRVLTEQAFAGRRLFEQQQVDGGEAFRRVFVEVLREALAGADETATVLEEWFSGGGSVDDLGKLLLACERERGRLTPDWNPEALVAAAGRLPDPEAVGEGVRRLKLHHSTVRAQCKAAAELIDALRARGAEAGARALTRAFLEWNGSFSTPKRVSTVFERLAEHRGRDPALDAYLDVLDTFARHPATAEAYLVAHLLPRIRERLSERKRAQGLFDFDDMLLGVRDALRAEGGESLRQALRRRYRYALIDEFQDTDEVQWEIFRTLFFDRSEGHRLFLIGDPKQAIYGFRNADVHTYLRARDEILGQGGTRVVLEENWRSTPELIEGYNRILSEDPAHRDGNEPPFFTSVRYDHPVRAGRPDRVLCEAGRPASPLVLVQPVGEVTVPSVRAAMAGFIAEEIQRITRPGEGLTLGDRGAPPVPVCHADIHILTRTLFEGLEIGRVLRRHGVPHAFYKQDGLFQTDEAEDVLAVLRALAHPEDRSARLRAWLTPFFGLGVADLAACRDLPEGDPLVARLSAWRALGERQDWTRLFREMLEESGLTRRVLFSIAGERELTNYQHLFETLLEESRHAPLQLPDLAARLIAFREGFSDPAARESGNVQRLETERQAVQILTMHKSKGLEAPVVFLSGGFASKDHGGLKVYHQGDERRAHVGWYGPGLQQAIQDEARHEAERLLYVAMTRAEGRLYLPFLPRDGRGRKAGSFNGVYMLLADRLADLVSRGDPALEARSVRTEVPCGFDRADADAAEAVRGWEPPAELLEPPAGDDAHLVALRKARAGVIVTSYSRMKSGYKHRHLADDAERDALRDDAEDAPSLPPGPDELPGGKGTGIFLHELLEKIDFAAVAAGWDEAALRPFFEGVGARHGVRPEHLPQAMALVRAALTTPVSVGGLDLPAGLCAVAPRVPEMPFVYPIPEAGQALSGAPGRPEDDEVPFRVGRGYVQGVIDLVFEHEGRFWLLDWKSDRLPDYGPAAVDAHVRAAYAEQAALYRLAVLRHLELRTQADYDRRFGGVLYCFLRGMGRERHGVWFDRPDWETGLKAAEAWLLDNQEWGVST